MNLLKYICLWHGTPEPQPKYLQLHWFCKSEATHSSGRGIRKPQRNCVHLWAWGTSQGQVTKVLWLSTSPASHPNRKVKILPNNSNAHGFLGGLQGRLWKIPDTGPWIAILTQTKLPETSLGQELSTGSVTSQPLNQPHPSNWDIPEPQTPVQRKTMTSTHCSTLAGLGSRARQGESFHLHLGVNSCSANRGPWVLWHLVQLYFQIPALTCTSRMKLHFMFSWFLKEE